MLSGSTSGDLFGDSVAIYDETIVIGAAAYSSSRPGSAYVYDISGSLITELTPSDSANSDDFGRNVAIYNQTIVVTKTTAAYVFDISGSQLAKLTPSDADGFTSQGSGYGIAIYGQTVVVGDKDDSTAGSAAGAAYIFDTSGTQIAKLVPSDLEEKNKFGLSVAIYDQTVIIGSRGDNGAGSQAGAVYIFDTSGNQITKFTALDIAGNDKFGYTVAIYEQTIVVGSVGDDDNGLSASGSAYVFDTAGNQLAKLTASDPEASSQFGFAVAIYEQTVVVGANKADRAYIFDTSGSQIVKLTPSNLNSGDMFGDAVAIYDGTVAVSSYKRNSDTGTVFLFSGH